MRQLVASFSFRMALTYAGLFVGSVLLLIGAYYLIVVRLPLGQVERMVRAEAAALANLYIVDGEEELLRRLRARSAAADQRKAFHAFIDRGGKVVTANLPTWPQAPFQGWRRIEADSYADGDEVDYEALVLDRRFSDGARLIVGRDIDNVSERERALASGATVVTVASGLLALIGGMLMSRSIGRRIDRIAASARNVMTGDMSGRIAVDGSDDAFDRLAQTLNAMLARIEQSMESVRRVSDSVAHELRTPLARLRASLEDALASREGDAPAVAEAVAEAERLGAIFDAVLRISRLESGSRDIVRANVNLSAVLEDVADFYRPEAEARGITLVSMIRPDLNVEGDADLLFQAVANLLDNAIKYTPGGGTVELTGGIGNDGILIAVRDTGPGIAPADLPRVTERFFRAGKVSVDGIGLGLTLVEAIARLHRTRLDFANLRPGFGVTWCFPFDPD